MNSLQLPKLVAIPILVLLLSSGIFFLGNDNDFRHTNNESSHRQLYLLSSLSFFRDPKSIALRTDTPFSDYEDVVENFCISDGGPRRRCDDGNCCQSNQEAFLSLGAGIVNGEGYYYDADGRFPELVDGSKFGIQRISEGSAEAGLLNNYIYRISLGGSKKAEFIYDNWRDEKKKFWKVVEGEGVFFKVMGSPDTDDVIVELFQTIEDFEYTVTIESEGRYTGVASPIDGVQGRVFKWTPSFSGNYQVLVHQVAPLLERSRIFPVLVPPSPYPITIQRAESLDKLERESLQRVPCQTVDRVDAYSKWDGDWVGPDTNFPYKIRTGWGYSPSQEMGCNIETFSRSELLSVREPKSIYVLGTSVQRGVFLSLADILLNQHEKEKFSESVIGKCWGRASVKKGNVEVVYQDFRGTLFEPLDAPNYVECHNNKMSKEPDDLMVNKAIGVWDELFENDARWPSVIFMNVAYNFNRLGRTDLFPFKSHIQHFVSTLPTSWDGTLIFVDDFMNGLLIADEHQKNYEHYLREIKEMLTSLNDRRTRWIDGMGLSKEMVMYSEDGPEGVGRSQHLHGFCDIPYVDEFESNTIRVCGNTTELVGQLLLGHALGPKAEYLSSMVQNPHEEDLQICHACPEDLLPFRLIPHPNMACTIGALHARGDDEVFTVTEKDNVCPAWCLDQDVVEVVPSQSDMIHIRRCQVE